ncbi:hypothetical protein ES703_18631 [subsurface metagenome]
MEFDEIEMLRKYRDEKKLTYPQIAKALGFSNISVYNWIKGYRKPSPVAKKLIRDYLMERM